MKTLREFLHNRSGATAIEYALIAGGISIVIVVAVTGIGSKLNTTFTQVQSGFQ
jgi:pilus assembly protein Flp/PilA